MYGFRRKPKVHKEYYRRPGGVEERVVVDYRGTQDIPDRPALLTCDFCCVDVDRLWEFRHRPVCVSLGQGQYMETPDASAFMACVYCRPLFEAGDIKSLVARVVTVSPHLATIPRVGLERVYGGVWDAREPGEPRVWHSGEERIGRVRK